MDQKGNEPGGYIERVAVIVCTRNRAALLARTLKALADQSPSSDPFDVLVVDDHSEDETGDLVRRAADAMPDLRLITAPRHGGLASSRNLGVQSCDAQFLLFTDDDCVPAPDWVAHMRTALRRAPIVAGAVESPREGYLALCHNVAEFHAFLPIHPAGRVPFIAGANMALRREVIEETGPFNESLVCAEDMEFALRARAAGYPIRFAPEAVVVHAHQRRRFGEILRYATTHAAATIQLRQAHRELLHTPLPLRSAPLLLLSAPLIALAVSAGVGLRAARTPRVWKTLPMVYLTKLAWCLGAAQGLRQSRRRPSC